MSAEAEKILGLANMLYVQNFVEEAIEKCHECITVAPHDASPYHTLGLIYEEKGDMAKAMDFYSIAAHVSKTDVALWLRIADMALTLENRRHAIYCLSRAEKGSDGILDDAERNLLRLNCADLFEEFGEKKKAIMQYEQIIETLGSKDAMIDAYEVHIKCMDLCMECNLKPLAAKLFGGYAEERSRQSGLECDVILDQFSERVRLVGESCRVRGIMSTSLGRKRTSVVRGDENFPAELRGDESKSISHAFGHLQATQNG